jgi:hypothetical protein
MVRTVGYRQSASDLLLPAQVLRLPKEPTRVDASLDDPVYDPVFFAPSAPHFHPVPGRTCTPAECYLRLMYLEFRYGLAMRACAPRSATHPPPASATAVPAAR